MIENMIHFGNMCTYNPFQGYIVELEDGGWVGCSPVSMKFGKTKLLHVMSCDEGGSILIEPVNNKKM